MDLGKELKTEFGRRIERDMTPYGKWNAALWSKIAFGDYYGKAPEQIVVIHRVVGEVVDNILRRLNLQMTADSWNGLRSMIDATDTAETALPDMEAAATNYEPRQSGIRFNFAFSAKSKSFKKRVVRKKKNVT